MNPDPRRRQWFGYLGSLLLILGAASALRLSNNGDVLIRGLQWHLPPSCWSRTALAMECPGCGATRSFALAASGHWRSAWRMHPAGTLLFGLVLLQVPIASIGIAMGMRTDWRAHRDRYCLWFFLRQKPIFTGVGFVIVALSLSRWLGRFL